ncbi:hypothetical protein BT63DRAFT_200042 [Microthyrium microscopicum]|uniref:Uncharacterized protein n=1 Tax=Microthyrium microscopicum TaxID=703497 RepID=A0A6A6UGE8_9PEZI|nr:hypothetical protein BT63DRAFT_200042 [Microthyrium microscopicum]
MPTYLLHGFRWPRPLIRIHIILNNLDDAAAEWLMAPGTTRAIKSNLASTNPEITHHLPTLQFIEQYDPSDHSAEAKSQPFAYVADIVHEIKLGIDIDEVRGKGVTNDAWGAMVDLRDKFAPGEKVAWFVVVCGDTERSFPPTVQMLESSSNGMYARDGMSDVTVTNSNGYSNEVNKTKSRAQN